MFGSQKGARMRLVRRTLAVAVVMGLATWSSAFAAGPTPVKATRNDEVFGSGNADYFAWSFISVRDSKTYQIKVQPTGEAAYSLNTRGKWLAGDMDPTGTVLSYYRLAGSGSSRSTDIFLYDMATQSNVTPPAGVNTSKTEFFPSLYGNQLTFERRGRSSLTLWLVTDLSTGDKVPVVTVDLSTATIGNPANLTGNWVTYDICRRSGCEAFRYDIALASTTKVPNPEDKLYFAPVADLAGNVYVERSNPGCGHQAKLVKWSGAGNPTAFYSFPPGRDMTSTSIYDDGGGITLYADVYGCASGNQDIVSFANP